MNDPCVGPRVRRGLLLGVCGLLAACGGEAPPPAPMPRPVAITRLQEMAPNPPLVLTGVAEPYREAEVSFEVAGRVIAILNVGRTVEVRSRPKTKEEMAAEAARRRVTGLEESERPPEAIVHVGDVLAEIDDTSYRQRLQAAQLKLRSAESGLRALRVDLEQVGPATLARAMAQREAARSQIAAARASLQSAESVRDTAAADFERGRKLLADRQIPRSEFDQLQNGFTTAEAGVEKAQASLRAAEQEAAAYEAAVTEAEAALRLKAETVAQTEAQLAELRIAVDQARTDLGRCRLRAPFSGRITYVYASQGDFVGAGKPVLRLTLIDPIKVSVTVSADREREILPGSHARVRPKALDAYGAGQKELFGTVFEKGAVADPATRTFRIDVMVRNARRRRAETDEKHVARIGFREILPAVERRFGEGGPLFVCRQCCTIENGETVIYRLKGGKFSQPRPPNLFEGPLELERLVIQLAGEGPEDFMQILNWSFQRVASRGEPALTYGDLLVSFERLDPRRIRQGLLFERFEWAIRPGDLVPVTFDGRASPMGLWVPDDAIRAHNERRSVFVVQDDRAREIPVEVRESSGRLRHVRGEGLEPGMAVVVMGVHYLHDGALVHVARETDLATYGGQAR